MDLHVVTAVFNPWRYASRMRLYSAFEHYVRSSGAKLTTIELALGRRPYVLPRCDTNIRVRTQSEMWHKERLLNLAIARLPRNWKYVAWIDADVIFARPDWASETVHLLQHFPVVQMFSHAIDLGPKYEPMGRHTSFMYAYQNELIKFSPSKYQKWHPGFAWAATREAIDTAGGLFDVGILGAGDRAMATALVGHAETSYPRNADLSKGYLEQLYAWQTRVKPLKKDIGYMPGTLLHHWHGKKVDRKYQDRWKILVDNKYDPEFDIKPDWQGLYQFTDNNPKLAQDIRKYFQARNEDSIDV